MVGAAIGVFLVEHVLWSVVFWINLPIGAVSIAMFALFLDEPVKRREHRIDYLGAALLIVGAGALMLALVQAPSLGGTVTGGLLVLGAGVPPLPILPHLPRLRPAA